jgi:antitoxin (DNA-binding transcriptional repressor) of toxin-antitoxin stability system
MDVPVTTFRKQIFELLSRAQRGESISVSYKGERFRIVPELAPKARLDRLIPMQVVHADYPGDHQAARRQIMSEMENEWEQDWSEL